MKKIILLSLVAVFFGSVSAQTAKKVSFDVNKGQTVQGYTIDFPGEKSDKVISDAFRDILEKTYNLKQTKSNVAKGFVNYVNQALATIASYPISIYFRVATEGKKNDKVTKFYLVVLDAGENPVPNELLVTMEPKIYAFLNAFPIALSDYENNLKLKEAQNLLEKQKNDYEKLKKEKAALEKSLLDKDNEIYSKEKEIQNSETEIGRLENLLKK
jgi:hypothetical protein